MPSISDRLKALGVKVGAQDLPPPKPENPNTIEKVLGGHPLETPFGETFVVEEFYPAEHRHGLRSLLASVSLDGLAFWAEDERIRDFTPHSFTFLDTETTGLSGGTGTYAFLIGVARFEGAQFHLAQFFMRDPVEETAQLAALEAFLAPSSALVTFNGKAFDMPLLRTRFLAHGLNDPFKDFSHVDLLHLSRRLWRDRLPSRTLGNLEVQILGTTRSGEDIPGWMIPQMYFDYLRSGDATPMKNVFYHNAMDVISLAALLHHTSALLADPLHEQIDHAEDIFALGKLFEDLGDMDTAARLYLRGLELELPETNLIQAILRLAMIYKRQEDWQAAIQLWEQAAMRRELDAFIELAKAYEHRLRDIQSAIHWTSTALAIIDESGFALHEKRYWKFELEHRLERLQRKNDA